MQLEPPVLKQSAPNPNSSALTRVYRKDLMNHSEEKTPNTANPSSLDFDSMTLERMSAVLKQIQKSRTIPRATKKTVLEARLQRYDAEMDELVDRYDRLQERHEIIRLTMKNLKLGEYEEKAARRG